MPRTIEFNPGTINPDRIIGEAPFGVIYTDRDLIISLINQAAADFLKLDLPLASLININLRDSLQHVPELHENLNIQRPSKLVPFHIDYLKIGHIFLNITGNPLAKGLLIVLHNTSLLKRSEMKVLSAMIQDQETERQQIAAEIHDGIIPLLSAIRLNLENILDRDDISLDVLSHDNVSRIIQALNETAQDLRALSHDLMPAILVDFGLIPAIQSYVKKIDASGKISIEFISNLDRRLLQEVELGLYRIFLELINNALKHSGAGKIFIQILDHRSSVVMTVEDNGKGAAQENGNMLNEGIGIRNIQARVKSLGGMTYIDTAPDRGYVTTIELPVKNP